MLNAEFPQTATHQRVRKPVSPTVPELQVARPALLAKLAGLRSDRHIFIVSPAGFGKTTVMREFREKLEANDEKTAWLTLNSADNDSRVLDARLRQAMSAIVREDEEPDWGITLESVQSCTLFLDNLHVLQGAVARELRASIAAIDCPDVRLVVGSRRGDASLREVFGMQHRVSEITADDLAFDSSQTKDCVQSRLPAAAATTHFNALLRQTKGWPAVLQMACTALRHSTSADLRSAPEACAISMFLMHEVFEAQHPQVKALLLDIAAASQFSVALVEHLHRTSDGANWTEMLLNGSLPLQRLDAGWFCLHPLFAQELIGLARVRNGARFSSQGRRAAHWFAASGRPNETVETLLNLGAHREAVQEMATLMCKLLADAQFQKVIRWCESLPSEMVEANPQLCSTYVVCLAYCNRREHLANWLPRCIARSRQAGADAAYADAVQLVQACELLLRGTPEQLSRATPSLEKAAYTTAQFERGSFACVLAYSHLAASNYAGAEESILVAKRIFREEKRMLGLAIAHSLEAVSAAAQGRLKDAVGCLEVSRLLVRQNQISAERACMDALTAGFAAALFYELDDLDRAADWARCGSAGLFTPLSSDTLTSCTLVAYRMALHQGKSAEASLLMQQAMAAAQAHEFARAAQAFGLEMARQPGAGALEERAGKEIDDPLLATTTSTRTALCIRPSEEIDGAGIAQVQLLLLEGRFDQARTWVDRMLTDAVAHKRQWREGKLRVLRCVVLLRQDAIAEAAAEMEHALALGAKTGSLRTFLDEREFMHHLRVSADGVSAPRLSEAASRQRDRLLRLAKNKVVTKGSAASTAGALSEQERRVLELIARGRTNKTAAELLQLSVNTIKWHLSHIYAKLGAHSRSAAVTAARERGWVE